MSTVVWANIARDVVHVRGGDAGTFLHSQFAQDIATLDVGGGVHSLLLDPTGHIVALTRVVRHEENFFTVDADAGCGQSIIDRLKRFILRSDVTLTLSDWCVRAFRGEEIVNIAFAHHVVVPAYWTMDQGVDVVGECSTLPEYGDATEPEHIDMFRVDAHWPKVGVDVLVGDIPATSGVVHVAASFTKGCYPGQELVERMDSRGSQAPVAVRALSREAVAVGTRLHEDGKDVGTVTSIGFTRALGRFSRQSSLGEPLR